MVDIKYNDSNSPESEQTFSNLMATKWILLFCVLTFLCAVAIYFTFLLFTNRYFQIAARPRLNTTDSGIQVFYV